MPHVPCTHHTTPRQRRKAAAYPVAGGSRRHKKTQRGRSAKEAGKNGKGQTIFLLAGTRGSQEQVVNRIENAPRLLKNLSSSVYSARAALRLRYGH